MQEQLARILFSRAVPIMPSAFIHAMHPKTAIRPEPAAMRRVLDAGWAGQLKIHGHRAQIHIPADPDQQLMAYNRHGQLHKRALPAALVTDLRRIFAPKVGWTAIDSEWLKGTDELFVFDLLKLNNKVLSTLTYAQRYEMLPRVYRSQHIQTLPIYKTVDKCQAALGDPSPQVEGLVFKALNTPGFSDTGIIRCRKLS